MVKQWTSEGNLCSATYKEVVYGSRAPFRSCFVRGVELRSSEMKLLLVLACVGLTALLGGVTAGRLLRVPRVYNALITTNEKVLPSRAYPFSAPLLHPIEYQPLSYFPINPYIGAVPLQVQGTAEEKPTSRSAEQPKEEEEEGPKEEAEETKTTAPEEAAPKVGNAVPYLTPISTQFTSQLGLTLPFYSPFNYYPTLLPYSYPLGLPSALTYSVPAISPSVQYSLPLSESVMNKPKDATAPDVPPPAAPSGSATSASDADAEN